MAFIDLEVFSRTVDNNHEPALDPVILKLFKEEITVKELIELTVEEQIRDLTLKHRMDIAQARRALDRQYLTDEGVDQQVRQSGAVRYRLHKSTNKKLQELNVEKEVQRAIRAFEKGSFLLLVDGEQMESLSEPVLLDLHTKVTFLRLNPLVGG